MMNWLCNGCGYGEPVARNETPDRKVCPECGSIMRAQKW